MCIIQLYSTLIWKIFPACILFEKSPDDIAKRSFHEEILLLKSKFLSKIGVVIWIEDIGDTFGFTSFLNCFYVVGVIEF